MFQKPFSRTLPVAASVYNLLLKVNSGSLIKVSKADHPVMTKPLVVYHFKAIRQTKLKQKAEKLSSNSLYYIILFQYHKIVYIMCITKCVA